MIGMRPRRPDQNARRGVRLRMRQRQRQCAARGASAVNAVQSRRRRLRAVGDQRQPPTAPQRLIEKALIWSDVDDAAEMSL